MKRLAAIHRSFCVLILLAVFTGCTSIPTKQPHIQRRYGEERDATHVEAQPIKSEYQDLATQQAMEDEAARFGEAVGLDSVSTFECIVDRDKHFFMEMNTRIQVEHRVTELCYALQFTMVDRVQNPSVTITKTSPASGITITATGPPGTLSVAIDNADTSALEEGTYIGQLSRVDAGAQTTLWAGSIFLIQGPIT